MAHKLGRIVYYLLRHGEGYVCEHEEKYVAEVRQRQEQQLHQRARELGYVVLKVEPSPIPSGKSQTVS